MHASKKWAPAFREKAFEIKEMKANCDSVECNALKVRKKKPPRGRWLSKDAVEA